MPSGQLRNTEAEETNLVAASQIERVGGAPLGRSAWTGDQGLRELSAARCRCIWREMLLLLSREAVQAAEGGRLWRQRAGFLQ